MGVAQIVLNEEDLTNLVISWYKLFDSSAANINNVDASMSNN